MSLHSQRNTSAAPGGGDLRLGKAAALPAVAGLVFAVVASTVAWPDQPLIADPIAGIEDVQVEVDAIPPAMVEVRPVPIQAAQVEAAAVEAAQRDARILGWVFERGLQALAAPVNGPAGIVLDGQRRMQIEQQAQQLERFFQPMLASELEAIRQACGSLAPAARRKILATGQASVKQTAKQFATRQLTGGLGQDGFDPREELRRPLRALLEEVAEPAELAIYEREQAARAVRRAEAARVMIVTKVDRQLDLTSSQRAAIEADLAEQWQADWLRASTEHGGLVNGYPVAPDYAAASIRSHLRPEQAAAWEAWCRAAGERLIGRQFGLNLDNQGIQTTDPWWGEAR